MRPRKLVGPRAVIDIGSNTVRLVIYEGTARAPEVVWNEKVPARLGRDLERDGTLPQEAQNEALAALARYALIIADLGIEDVQTVATAAARDAMNGAEFLARVAQLGLTPRLLSGEEEACASAKGAIGAFPGARGVVADLGGGSLELVSIREGECRDAASLPLGTLRLPTLQSSSGNRFATEVHRQLAGAGWAAAHPGPLYMIGGTWRAFATYAMRQTEYPLDDPHGFTLATAEADRLAQSLIDSKPEKLSELPGISAMRAGFLPNAAALLRALLAEFEPDHLVFSSWGIREGLLFARLEPLQQLQDPLLAGVAAFAAPRNASITDAALLAAWSVDLANGQGNGTERLRLAAAQLALALHRVEPNLRMKHAAEWSLDKRWIALDPRGRAMICAALLGSLGKSALPPGLALLASDEDLREAITWGLGFRVAQRLGAASRMSMTTSALVRKKRSLVLRLDESRAALANSPVPRDLQMLAEWVGLKPKIKIGSFEFADPAPDEE